MMGLRSSHHRFRKGDSRTRQSRGKAWGVLGRHFAIAAGFLVATSAISSDLVAGSILPPASADVRNLTQELLKQAPTLRADVLKLALAAADSAAHQGLLSRPDLLTVIDYSLPSTEPRMFVFDLDSRRLLFKELVAHGKNSGEDIPTHFSNREGSLASSLGLFVTAGTYVGNNGYSLRLKGLEKGVNDRAWKRAIVMHGASYVNATIARTLGRLGRSWGCPAVRKEVARKIIDTVKGGSAIFAYYPDDKWLAHSKFLKSSSNSA